MSNSPARKLPTIWFYGAVAVSALLVAATALSILGLASGPAASLLAEFRLTAENNPAAWWSGMLLAVVSLHAYDGHALLRRREPGAAMAWALIAAVLLFLSADEVGSIHERLAQLGRLGLGRWSLLLPLGAVLAVVLGRAAVLLWSAGGEQRRKVWPIAVGFLLLGSVALQEFIEHRVHWPTDAALAARAAVEEGTELLGTLVLLGVAMSNTSGLAARGTADGRPAFAALHELRRPLLALGLALAPALALATASWPTKEGGEGAGGQPADWLAATAFLAAGLFVCRPLFRGGRDVCWQAWGVGGLCCLASVAVVVLLPVTPMIGFGPVEVQLRMLVLGAISLLVCVTWLSMSGDGWRAYAPAVVVLGLMAAAPLLPTSLAFAYLLPQLLALLVYRVGTTAVQESAEGVSALPQRPRPR